VITLHPPSDKKIPKFEFAFIDADKENMKEYFDLIFPMIKKYGIIAADNILFPKDYRAEMKNYISHIKSKYKLQTITVPIGNGEEITLKEK